VEDNKRTNYFKLGTEAIWVAVGQLLGVLGSLIGIRVLTSEIEPAEYGMLAILISFATAAQYLPGVAISDTAMRFYSEALSTTRLAEYRVILTKVFVRFAALFSVVTLVGLGVMQLAFPEYASWVIPASVFAVASVGYLILVGVFNGARARRAAAFIQSLFQIGRFTTACIMVLWFGASVVWAMWGFAIGAALTAFVGYYIFTVNLVPETEKSESPSTALNHEMLVYGWPLLVTGVLTWVSFFMDRWLLGLFGTAEEIGKYFALFQVGFFPAIIGGQALRQFISPLVFSRITHLKNHAEKKQVYRINFLIAHSLVLITLAGFFGALFTHEFFFSILVGEAYRSVSYLWPYMILAGGLSVSSTGLIVSMFADNRTKAMIPLKFLTTVIIACCLLVGVRISGLTGIVYGLCVFSVIELIITEVFLLRTVYKSDR